VIFPPLLGAIFILFAACCTAGSRGRRALGIALALTALLPPWLVPPEHPLVRAGSALVAFTGVMRVIDLYRGQWPLRERLGHVVSVVDTRRLVRAPPRLDARALLAGLAWLLVAVASYRVLRAPVSLGGASFWLERWGCGLAIIYAGVAALYPLLAVAYGAIGFVTPPLHVAPVMSRSVQELWGERWARPISAWLGETFFRPYARRRRPLGGALVAFAASATFHAYVTWVALGLVNGLAMAGCMFAYFVVQAVVMAIERTIGARRWSPRAGHAWTVGCMLATAPLFLEPAVRVLGMPAR
jgi:hypothetical protein